MLKESHIRAASLLFATIVIVGCAQDRAPNHTRLFTADRRTNIWSPQPIAGEGHVARPLRSGEHITLRGGAVVSFDGKHVAVNGQPVDDLNALVDAEGRVHPGIFIRNFD